MKVLVAGASGFLGEAVVQVLSKEHTLRLFDIREAPVCEGHEMVVGDVSDFEATSKAVSGVEAMVDVIMAPEKTYDTPVVPFNVNVRGMYNLLEAARQHGVKRIVHMSTGAIFGGYGYETGIFWDDKLPPKPDGIYALTKALQEDICRYFAAVHGLSIVCFRPLSIVDAATRRDKYGNLLTAKDYNWGFIDRYDIAQACRLALTCEKIAYEVFFLASTLEAHRHCDVARTVQKLGWKPKHDFADLKEKVME